MKVFSEGFPPPPPLPPHLSVPAPDPSTLGATGPFLCNLCSWAQNQKKISSPDSSIGASSIGWIVIISIAVVASSAITAIAMKIVPWCWRRFGVNSNNIRNANNVPRVSGGETNRVIESEADHEAGNRRKIHSHSPAQNHYTHMEREHSRQISILNTEGSIPSSAYYSELSSGDFTYETIDLQTIPHRPFSRIPASPTSTQPEYE